MSCDLCHKVTKFPIIIRRKEEEVGINSKRQLCLNCFEKTPPSNFVPNDEKNTNEQKEIECNLCGQMFVRQCDLTKHFQNIHVDDRKPEKPFECNLCDKKYTQNSHLMT